MKYRSYILKRKIEDVLLLPFIAIGRLLAYLKPLDKAYETFYFFPFYHTGGAEKVHALITQATGNNRCIIFFTRKSADDNFYDDFVQSNCTIKNIAAYTDNKWLYFMNLIYRGMISGYINRQTLQPLVFNGQCNFGYKLSPWIKTQVPQIELIHSFNTFSLIRLPFLPFISKTVMISKLRIEDHLRQYKQLEVPQNFNTKIEYIVNGIQLPQQHFTKSYEVPLQVLYVGRGTGEKRVHFIAKMAAEAANKKLQVQFIFMGDVAGAIPAHLLPYCKLLGSKKDTAEIESVYQQAHVVIITSSTEGFPMVIEEGMAHGCTILSTPVGDVPYHVKQGINGFLFSSVNDEAVIIEEGIGYLTRLCEHKNMLVEMGETNKNYAIEHFGIEAFNNKYTELFNQLRKQ